ncbi:MAG: sodium/solute symporter [Melioribacteraceae bacterium]|nr:sodium/solute symporter [Melioribacteraceae bacterium]
MSSNLTTIDNLLILLYFAVVLIIGLTVSRSQDNPKKQYFLAGQNLSWLVIGSSLFAISISSEHLVGLASAGSLYGIGIGYFEFLSAIILLILGWAFAPMLIKSNVFTIPQFFGKRYDNRSRVYISILSVFVYLAIKIGVALLVGGLVMKGVLGWNMLTSTIFIVLLTGLYTVIGGMNSVVFTQFFQAIVLLVGALLLTLFSMNEIGGFTALSQKLPVDYQKLINPLAELNISWLGILIGAPIIGIWYWCSDQYIIQRIFAARSIRDAKKGTLLASMLKIFPLFLFIIPGLVATVLYPTSTGSEAYAMLLNGSFLPVGIKGIVIAGFLAALMSTLSGALNSAASLFALDIYGLFKPKATEDELVLVGRLSTMLFIIMIIAVIPTFKYIDSNVYTHIQDLQAYIAPPIVSVLLVGLLWKNASGIGAIWALLIGGVLGLSKMILTSLDPSFIESFLLLRLYNNLDHLNFAVFLFAASSAIIIALSLVYSTEASLDSSSEKNKIENFNESLDTSINQINQNKISINKPKREIVHK